MKKALVAFLGVVMMSLAVSCSSGGGGSSGGSGGTLVVHYQRTAADYENYTLWLWLDTTFSGTWPKGLDYDSIDDFGAVFNVPLKANASSIGFVPVNKTIGDDSKDAGDHIFNFLSIYKEVWVFEGDSKVYVSADKQLAKGMLAADILSETELSVTFTDQTVDADVNADPAAWTLVDKNEAAIAVSAIDKTALPTVKLTIPSTDYNTLSPYTLTYDGVSISVKKGYKLIDNLYGYSGGDLGVTYNSSNGSATFKVWAPFATAAKVKFWDKTDQKTARETVDMVKGDKGVWSVTVTTVNGESDLKGYYYQYLITNNGVEKACLDPYAKSMAEFHVDTDGNAVTGKDPDKVGKAAIVDLTTTGSVSNYASIAGYTSREKAIIYEVHVRDFTSFWGVTPAGTTANYPGTATAMTQPTAPLGSYKAFIENLNYIKNMGYTHVQLLPVMNFYYGDESNKALETTYKGAKCNYNWGYDPHSYFSPEGMYASNADPHTRVKELKELVQAIHDAGMGVILDVVYTHMAKASFLEDIAPGYYFFMQNGNLVGGFGNNLATSHMMAKKLMIDSIKYWVSEYKVDGFRFDMMGDADSQSIIDAYDAAVAINPNVLFVGEGWRTYAGEADGLHGATQDAMNEMNDGVERVAVFSDEFRNLLKSGFGAEGDPKFISGGAVKLSDLFSNIKAQPTNFNTAPYSLAPKTAGDPGQVVQYISAHDNMTLADIIARHTTKYFTSDGGEIHKRIRIGNLMVLTSQGIPFFVAGQDLGGSKEYKGTTADQGTKITTVDFGGAVGTKKFVHDSYDSSDAVNMINWSAIEAGKPGNLTMNYTRGLIALRKSTNAFSGTTLAGVDASVTRINFDNEKLNAKNEPADKVIGFKATDGATAYYVLINADTAARTVTTPEDLSAATVIVDDDEAGTAAVSAVSGATISATSVTLEPLTAVIIKK